MIFGVTGCFNKFNGMWALIIYDIAENLILISRDRFGLKPLYYFEDKNKIVFASEIKAIHKAGLDSKKIDLENAKLFLVNGDNSWASDTILTSVKRFPARSYCALSSVNPGFDLKNINYYWTLKINKGRYNFNKEELDKNLNIYRELLKSSIKLRQKAAVKVGATLSGGFDSSSIVYFMLNKDESRSTPLETFSNVYEDIDRREFQESPHINLVTDFLKVNNHKTTPINESVFDDFSEMIYHADLPTNFSNISGWYTYKLIKQKGTKITLDGLAADGMFAGSNADYKNYFNGLKIKSFLNELMNTKKNFPEFNPTKMILFRLMVSFPENSWWNPFKFYFKQRNHLYLSLNESLSFFFNHELFNGLHYIDSMSMAHSIESRQPFLDYRLVEFAFALNQSYKISQGWTKHFCRLAMSGLLPDEVVWRKDETGWPNADELWFDNIHKDKVANLLGQSKLLPSLISSDEMKVFIDGKINEKKMRALSLSMWEMRFL